MVKPLAIFMGSAFLFGGLLGFVPGVVRDGMYFGIFMVNPPHNILHIASGAIFLIASMIGAGAARLWFQVFGLFYAAMAVWGFQVGEGIICGVISNNRYDSWGHAALALTMLLIGFALPKQMSRVSRTMWRRPMTIKRAGAFLWRTLETLSGGGSDAVFDAYDARLSRLEALAPGELEARISRLEAAVLSNGASASSGRQVVQ